MRKTNAAYKISNRFASALHCTCNRINEPPKSLGNTVNSVNDGFYKVVEPLEDSAQILPSSCEASYEEVSKRLQHAVPEEHANIQDCFNVDYKLCYEEFG